MFMERIGSKDTEFDMEPLKIKQLVTKLAYNIEVELAHSTKLGSRPKSKEKSRLQKISEIVAQGKFKPEVSCLCAELDLAPTKFVEELNAYLRNPRLIVKDPVGSHKVLHVNNDGT